ncbi:hypothetical protein ACFR99_05980 [Haloarchaeobius amylolyticus]|uniref:Uncharacterized protein n=1 Tax=Haloarchaeobius amylolyticus TaxID=1198296 RepID=A0ABD6BDE9_9EURY
MVLHDIIFGVGWWNIASFLVGALVGGILGQLVPNLLYDFIRGPKIQITGTIKEGGNYYCEVLNSGRGRAENCIPRIKLQGQGEFSHWQNPREGVLEHESNSFWVDNGKKKCINRDEVAKFHLFQLDEDASHGLKVKLPTEEGYDSPQKILKAENDSEWRGTDDVRDFQSIEYTVSKVEITCGNTTKTEAHIRQFPWEDEEKEAKLKLSLLTRLRFSTSSR